MIQHHTRWLVCLSAAERADAAKHRKKKKAAQLSPAVISDTGSNASSLVSTPLPSPDLVPRAVNLHRLDHLAEQNKATNPIGDHE